MRYLLLLPLLLLPACGAIKKAEELLDRGIAVVKKADEQFETQKTAADKDGDGKVSGQEWMTYLLGLLGLGGTAGGAQMLRNGKSNERKARMEADIESLKRTVKPS